MSQINLVLLCLVIFSCLEMLYERVGVEARAACWRVKHFFFSFFSLFSSIVFADFFAFFSLFSFIVFALLFSL